ncbi:MAG: hypothetical protein K2M98_01860 [Muribaculum sp.]|nr:hypothetical protein [Muribaculum sp.]
MPTRKKQPRRTASKKRNAASPFSREFKSFACGLVCLVLIVIGLSLQGGCSSTGDDASQPDRPDAPTRYEGLRNVKTNPALTESLLDHYSTMKVSFNADAHQPNWVAWELTADRVGGSVPRAENFLNDPRVYGCPYTSD